MEFDDYEKLHSNTVGVHMTAGAVAGIFEHVLMYPVDSVKTRMQSLAPSPEATYRSVREGLFKMASTEGLMRLVKGVNAVIVGAGPAHAFYFSAYEGIKNTFPTNNPFLSHAVNAAAGGSATLLHDAIMVPADVVKQRLQMYNSPYSSSWHCVRQIYRREGFGAFYRSYTTQMAMNVPHHAIVILTYEKLQKTLNKSKEYNPVVHCFAGAVAGTIASAVTNPLDVCKTLLNTQESSTLSKVHKSRISGIGNAVKTIYVLHGVSGFFRGLQARVLYQMPSTAVSWTIYELFKHFLTGKHSPRNRPETGSDLLLDNIITADKQYVLEKGATGTGGWSSAGGPLVQEKIKTSYSVDRLRGLSVGPHLSASCSASSPNEKLLAEYR